MSLFWNHQRDTKTSYAKTTHKTKNIAHKQKHITYEVKQGFIFFPEKKLFN